MRRCAFLLCCLLFPLTAPGADRIADLRPGVACERIPGIEQSLGSIALGDRGEGSELSYRGIQGARTAMISYHCVAGALAEQRILVVVDSREEALGFADAQRRELVRRLGDPIHDGLRLPTWRKLLYGFLGADLDYLTAVVIWGNRDEDPMLRLSQTDAQQWQVSISQGSSKLEYIINS